MDQLNERPFDPGLVQAVARALSIDCASGPENAILFTEQAEKALTAVRTYQEDCESCDDTGIYEEGDEWAPCLECEVGRGFAERLKTHAEEVRQSERQRVRKELVGGRAERAFKEASGVDRSAAAYLRGINAALDSLEDEAGEEAGER